MATSRNYTRTSIHGHLKHPTRIVSIYNYTYAPPPSEGVGDILFLVWIPSASASALASA